MAARLRVERNRVRPLVVDRRGRLLRRALFVGDAVAIAAVFAFIALLLDAIGRPGPDASERAIEAVFVAVWLVLAALSGLYHQDQRRINYAAIDEVIPVFRVVTLWAWLLVLAEAVVVIGPTEVLPAVLAWLLVPVGVLAARALARSIVRRTDSYRQRVVIIGTEEDSDHVERRLRRHPEFGLEVAARIDPMTPGTAQAIARLKPDRVVLATSPVTFVERTRLLRDLLDMHVHIDVVSGDAHVFRSIAVLHDLEGLPMLALPPVAKTNVWNIVKRGLDLAISVPALVVLSPLLGWCAWRIRHDSPGPALFRQDRAGLRGETFQMVKFRTMVDRAEDQLPDLLEDQEDAPAMFKLTDDPRVTKVGARLRKRSLDELPQLINVIRGDMSLVGPRPLPMSEAARVSGPWAARMDVRPGMTGPWQVSGRSDIPFEDMIKLDLNYVANWSVGDDMKLLARTLAAVGSGRGAY